MTPALFLVCALALPPCHKAVLREFKDFMDHNPNYEYFVQFDRPPERKQRWQAVPYLWKSYRVFIRRAG